MTTPPPTEPNAETVKMLPCPACGQIPTLCENKYSDSGRLNYWVSCYNPECSFETCDGRIESTKEKAIAAWNTRHESDELKRLSESQARLFDLSIINADKIRRLTQALELIAHKGGKTTDDELGLSCNGSWCAEQARAALEEKE